MLMPLVEDALNSSDLKPDLDLLAVSGGPGSSTGSHWYFYNKTSPGNRKPAVSVPTLMPWHGILLVEWPGVPLMDARREQAYTSLYRREGSGCIRLMPIQLSCRRT